MSEATAVPQNPEQDDWDVIVVGTGMGGSTVGYELARRGRRVLFLEKGKFLHGEPDAAGDPPPDAHPDIEARLRAGRWPLPLQGRTSFGETEFIAPWGCGTGGSTTIYGAQLERFTAVDFVPRRNFPDVKDANLPERWPISYEELVPYYRIAEALYRIRGTQDPLNADPKAALRDPPRLSERDQVYFDSFHELGLHPYQSHVGFDYSYNCRECFDFCPRGCKSDSATICLMPALTNHGAPADRLRGVGDLADRSRVTAVRARWKAARSRSPPGPSCWRLVADDAASAPHVTCALRVEWSRQSLRTGRTEPDAPYQ
jgi:choline dehydrogenase-like flavoprotein